MSNFRSSEQPPVHLTPEAASRICMEQCRAMCCRGPLILRLAPAEVAPFHARAERLGITVQLTESPTGGGWVKFSDHTGERCPMLDPSDFSCRIYEDRPDRCRRFPEKPEPGCAISGWVDAGQS